MPQETISIQIDIPAPVHQVLKNYIRNLKKPPRVDSTTGDTVIEPLFDTPYGSRKFTIADPDGNISLDQRAAETVGSTTRFPSLTIGSETGIHGGARGLHLTPVDLAARQRDPGLRCGRTQLEASFQLGHRVVDLAVDLSLGRQLLKINSRHLHVYVDPIHHRP